MKNLLLAPILIFAGITAGVSQTCTITTTQNWDNATPPSCSEGGNAGSASHIIIPSGVTVTFNDAVDTWTGTRIHVFGILKFSATGAVNINSSVTVKSGGIFRVDTDGSFGTASGCGYNLIVDNGGKVDLSGGKTLSICGAPILRNGGVCGPYPIGPPPYCEPVDGFKGPTGFDEDGINLTLPVKLSFFNVRPEQEHSVLEWATTSEENFYKFVIQRAIDGVTFEDIGEVQGQGFNIHDIESRYLFVDEAPMLGTNYYRLKAVDLDNSYEYFDVRALKIKGSKVLSVYPNPSNGEGIAFRANFNCQESDRIIVIDQLGVQVFSGLASAAESNIIFQDRLQPGVYMLRYVSKDFEQVTRVVVRH